MDVKPFKKKTRKSRK